MAMENHPFIDHFPQKNLHGWYLQAIFHGHVWFPEGKHNGTNLGCSMKRWEENMSISFRAGLSFPSFPSLSTDPQGLFWLPRSAVCYGAGRESCREHKDLATRWMILLHLEETLVKNSGWFQHSMKGKWETRIGSLKLEKDAMLC